MPLITLKDLSLSYGTPPLLDAVNLHIDANERVCLLGRNGAGKSTLLRLINGEIQADDGSITVPPGIRIAKLNQEVPADLEGTINEVVADGLEKPGNCYSVTTIYYTKSPWGMKPRRMAVNNCSISWVNASTNSRLKAVGNSHSDWKRSFQNFNSTATSISTLCQVD